MNDLAGLLQQLNLLMLMLNLPCCFHCLQKSHEAKAKIESLCLKGEVTIEDLIRAMAEPLTSTRNEERAKGEGA